MTATTTTATPTDALAIAEEYEPHYVSCGGVARSDYPTWQARPACPWCGGPDGSVLVVVDVRTADGRLHGCCGHAGYVHAAHVDCLPDALLAAACPAEVPDDIDPSLSLCVECLVAGDGAYTDEDIEAMPDSLEGAYCHSCAQSLREHELQERESRELREWAEGEDEV